MKKKHIRKNKILKLLQELGHNQIELSYTKGEGWWLCSDKFDDWLAMDSYGCYLRINKEFLRKCIIPKFFLCSVLMIATDAFVRMTDSAPCIFAFVAMFTCSFLFPDRRIMPIECFHDCQSSSTFDM